MADTIFLNADYIVIEYLDLIKSPYMSLLYVIRNNPKLREILKLEEIDFLDDAALCEWYINRKHKNFLVDLNRYPEQISEKQLDEILEDQMNTNPKFYELAPALLLDNSVLEMKRKKMCKDVIIYHEHHNTFAKNELERRTGETFTFMTNFEEILKKTGSNSTYFLSNIDNIERMANNDVLKMSSVTLALEYRYNKKNMKDFKLDFDKLTKEHPFKLSFFRACTYDPYEKNME